MKTIWKYNLHIKDMQRVWILEPAKVLSVLSQRNQIVLYAEVETNNVDQPDALKPIDIWVHGTGHEITAPEEACFVGTVKLMNGNLMFHVYVLE